MGSLCRNCAPEIILLVKKKKNLNIQGEELLNVTLASDSNSSGTILKGQSSFHTKIIQWSLLKQSQKTDMWLHLPFHYQRMPIKWNFETRTSLQIIANLMDYRTSSFKFHVLNLIKLKLPNYLPSKFFWGVWSFVMDLMFGASVRGVMKRSPCDNWERIAKGRRNTQIPNKSALYVSILRGHSKNLAMK